MTSSNQADKPTSSCRNCNRRSAAPGNFCRWCGAERSENQSSAASTPNWRRDRTTILVNGEPRSFSSLPLNALTRAMQKKTGSLRLNKCGALFIAVLIAIPMWLLIILLSPFDAYVSARTAWSQMDIR